MQPANAAAMHVYRFMFGWGGHTLTLLRDSESKRLFINDNLFVLIAKPNHMDAVKH